MDEADARQHPMKMVRRRLRTDSCRHEHGMDRSGGLDEVTRRFNRVNAP